MFNYIKGDLIEKRSNAIVVENSKIGYDIFVSSNTMVEIGNIGDYVTVYTYFQLREDGVSLFGFASEEEKRMFLSLITVNGVGPKMALSILSSIRLNDLIVGIISGDIDTLSKSKGCGKKIAERIIIELKDKVDAFGVVCEKINCATNLPNLSIIDDACDVLVNLGLSQSEAQKVTRLVALASDTVEEVVEKSLRGLER